MTVDEKKKHTDEKEFYMHSFYLPFTLWPLHKGHGTVHLPNKPPAMEMKMDVSARINCFKSLATDIFDIILY